MGEALIDLEAGNVRIGVLRMKNVECGTALRILGPNYKVRAPDAVFDRIDMEDVKQTPHNPKKAWHELPAGILGLNLGSNAIWAGVTGFCAGLFATKTPGS